MVKLGSRWLCKPEFRVRVSDSPPFKEVMTEREEKQTKESIQAYQNMIQYMKDQIEILERQMNKDKNFTYKFNITKK